LIQLQEADLTILPHSPEWYDRLATLQDGYYYPWKSELASNNGEAAYFEMLHQHITPEKDVLDVGCGHGDLAIEIAPLCRTIFAYDRVTSYIRIALQAAQTQNLDNLTFECFDSSPDSNGGEVRIPAGDESFDLLISRRGPLHWLEDARRVARPGACIIQLNPLETPLPDWAEQLPEPLRAASGLEYRHGILNSVKHRLAIGGLELHSAWTYDVPEFFDQPQELYKRLTWGYIPGEVPDWSGVSRIIRKIYADYAGAQGLVLRHTRLLWKVVVEK
jgi:23S rRNA (guanine745-N1)-methyltransferase